jgi:hypothetical protein
MNLKIDLMLINPDTKAQIPQKTLMMVKLIIQFAVNDLEKKLKMMIPVRKTKMAMINRALNLNLKILQAKNICIPAVKNCVIRLENALPVA